MTPIDLRDDGRPEISVVMPCLNEAGSVGLCVEQAWAGIHASGLRGEVIVADNGSTDDSVARARAAGARVVHEPAAGYGNAYLRGFAEARGGIVVMGDSDNSYDFGAIPDLVAPLVADESDYVLGSRFGGTIQRGAMTWSHRYVGNPILTTVLNVLFDLDVSDAHSGLRAFTRPALDRMGLQCEGMELASEIVVKAARSGLRVAEVPIVYHPRIGESKLKSMRDGWRHLRFLLTLSPVLVSVIPGLLLAGLGVLAEVVLAFAGSAGGGLWAKVAAALAVSTGTGLTSAGLCAGAFSLRAGSTPPGRLSSWLDRRFSVERTVGVGLAAIVAGAALVVRQCVLGWSAALTTSASASLVVAALLLLVVGVQLCAAAFVVNVFLVLRPRRVPVGSGVSPDGVVTEGDDVPGPMAVGAVGGEAP